MADNNLSLDDCFDVIPTETRTSANFEKANQLDFAEMNRIAVGLLGADGHDAFQEWFIRALPGICRRYDGRVPFRAYAIDSLRRWCMQYRRRQRRWPSLRDDVADNRPPMPCRVWQSDLRRKIDDALRQLPGAERTVFLLVKREGLSRTEAAQRLGCTLGALDARLFRAKQQLKKLLKDLAEFL